MVQPADIARIALVNDPRVSPDGTMIAFVVTHADVDDNVYRSAVWIAAADGSTPPRPFSAGEHGDGQPVWSPDGRWLAFTSRRGDDKKSTLHVAPVDGPGEVRTLCTRDEAVEEPAGERTPVLLSIHGGPMTQYGETWFDEFQMWTGAGYAVVFCNPHGSTGGTQAWARAIRAPEAEVDPGTGWGGIDADDVLTVLDAALAANPDLDPDRVGVLGGSYGGYLTSWLIGHTDRFVAACSERAVNNLESLEWASDAAGFFRFEIGVDHVRRPDVYRRMSPITYVQDVRTPVLILHSEDDLRCPIDQADQLFVALRILGKPVTYHRFDSESHGLGRTGSPRHRVQRAEIILDWFARHLGGRGPRPVVSGNSRYSDYCHSQRSCRLTCRRSRSTATCCR